ncbi:MAG: copper homeostasis protein CutC, partial [Eubacteriales bacterium]
LIIGGTTPSVNLARLIKEHSDIKINVLIRPRFGDFLYTEEEIEIMCRDILMFKEAGVNGIVIGALTAEGRLNMPVMKRLMEVGSGLEVTLHRAFDMTEDPYQALEDAIALGVNTILTSGQQQSAEKGKALLKELREKAGDRIEIMAGAGVKKENIKIIHEYTGITTFHGTGRKDSVDSGMIYRKSEVSMGLPSLSEYEIWQTDPEEIREFAKIVHSL